MEIYIRGGETFKGLAPLGTYRIKYATGKSWYGRDLLFDDTVTSQADRTLKRTDKNFLGLSAAAHPAASTT